MPYAILLTTPGDASQLVWQEVPMPTAGAGEVLVRQEAAGLNFIDIYHRTGFYPLPSYPIALGLEAAGVVEAVGEGCRRLKKGDRVAYGAGPIGAYSECRTIAEDKLITLPEGVTTEAAASLMLKGLTAQYLLRQTFHVKQGDTLLVHSAAGGVGLLLAQWAKYLSARVIGTVGSDAKAERARAAGCDEVIFYRREDTAARVRALTGGRGVEVVYDAVGKDTYQASLDSLAPLGMFVSFGQASGPMPLIDSQDLMRRGSLCFTRPSLMHYVAKPEAYIAAADEMLALVSKGILTPTIGQRFALKDAADAHRALESGKTQGATILSIR